jgi:GrpB-like predicted nucleotidyltransferase (UPF0157 family)/aminoglycoside phosphotransferase (APT) family kinase protein/GNAT superfamily N-acetyltransferase
MFKANWEKSSATHQLPNGLVEQMVRLAYPDKKLTSSELIAGGCANLNIKIHLEGTEQHLILRVYLHDKDAAYREQKLAALLKETVPVPLTYYVGELADYQFAITEFMPGIPLRDLLLGQEPHDIGSIMYEVGSWLAKISSHKFPNAGFFDRDLHVKQGFGDESIKEFSLNCLKHPEVKRHLSTETMDSIERLLKQSPDYPNATVTLVHADFDPANILVERREGAWRVTGILDWEFAYAGSWFDDVATMLRYAHKMPSIFEEAFIQGLLDQGQALPANWKFIVPQFNIGALLDGMTRHPLHLRPNIRADICELIDYFLSELSSMAQSQRIEVTPYNQNWPNLFETEANAIKEALGDNCIEIHHIGSTSVPRLAAKPIIDMIPVVRDIALVDASSPNMIALGYEVKGEYGMLFRRYFKKDGYNIHVYESGSGEIDRCIKFRDWMRYHPVDRDAYAALKQKLAEQFPNDILSYCTGKDEFVAAIDKKTAFAGLRVVKALTTTEWAAAKHFRQKYFFNPNGIDDPYTWTFDYPEHVHIVLYHGSEIVGYTHIQLWKDSRAAIRIIVIDEAKRNRHLGSQFLQMCEKWLKSQGYSSIHAESSPAALEFYRKNGYIDIPFNDPDGYECSPDDIAVGKML